jgi:diguanylate cyclase (GGDEF)-like protein/PAS domain S-box-containing protein
MPNGPLPGAQDLAGMLPAIILLNLIVTVSIVAFLLLRVRQSRHAEKAIESVGSGYWVLNANADFIDVNAAYCRMVGYTRSQILSMRIADFEAVATQDRIRAQIQRIIHQGPEQFETRHRKRNGDWVELEITVTAVGTSQVIVYLRDISERKKAALEINQLALYDPLTALPNRRLLYDRVEQALLQASRSEHHGALLFIDLDHFKKLNDTLGHAKGDNLLRQVGQRLVACVREGDTVARFGGDEFVVLLARLSGNATDAAAEVRAVGMKILASLARTFVLDNVEHNTTASIGVSLFSSHAVSLEDVLKQADLAMYKSKAAGRNGLHFFDPAMQVAIEARTSLEADLRLALREQQFVLYYQPQACADGTVTGAEALVRWQHPVFGLVQPNDFIGLAEESGLILPLGQWVLEAACQQLAQWAGHYQTVHLVLAVNVSAKQLQQPDFVEQVLATLQRSGADPRKLQLELTESVLVSNVEDVIAKMNALKARGVSFSLDDFGTGYSSLGYLSRLPIEQLKIDRSFVSQIELSDNAVSICVAVIGLARSLRLTVVAEGVETQAQLYLLTTVHHCQFVQGYLIGRPLPIQAFDALLE